jgi:Tfp pilus assembly protein PilN
MLRLNLIAEEAKQAIKYQRLYFLLLKTEVILFILILLVAVAVVGAKEILSSNIYQNSQQTAKLIAKSSTEYSAAAREINEKIAVVAQIENGFVPYSQIVRQIVLLIPATVSLSSMYIDSSMNTIEIRGLAPVRDNLINLKNALNGASWLTNVNVPPEEEFNKNNIDFDIKMDFNASKLPAS